MSEEQEERDDAAEAMVKNHVRLLMEHFDSVRIFVTRHEGPDEMTMNFSDGNGNFYAQWAQVREWVLLRDEETREKARREFDEDDDEAVPP